MVRNPKIIAMLMLSASISYAMEKPAADSLFCDEKDEDLEQEGEDKNSWRQQALAIIPDVTAEDLECAMNYLQQPNPPSTSDTSRQTQTSTALLSGFSNTHPLTADSSQKNIKQCEDIAIFDPCVKCVTLYTQKKALLLQHLQYKPHKYKYRDKIQCQRCWNIFMDADFFTDHILKSKCYKEKS